MPARTSPPPSKVRRLFLHTRALTTWSRTRTQTSWLLVLVHNDGSGDYPQAWYREYGEGRSFYTSLGHREETWSQNDVFRAHLTGGIRWALGLED